MVPADGERERGPPRGSGGLIKVSQSLVDPICSLCQGDIVVMAVAVATLEWDESQEALEV